MYYRDAQAVLLVFDLTSMESFQSLDSYKQIVLQYSPSALLVVVGNKLDKVSKRVCR
jgi:GTPase SAR1 family protein